VFLAQRGFAVTGVDFSPEAIAWAQQRAAEAGMALSLITSSVFDAPVPEGEFELVVDSGCFHHLPPHRRAGYVQRVHRALAPGGHLALTCFRPEGGSGLSDAQVYERGTLGGGLGYTEAELRQHWSSALQILELRPMRKPAEGSGVFGEAFLWVMLGRKEQVGFADARSRRLIYPYID
jgi:SAM-dependent methyltransferase